MISLFFQQHYVASCLLDKNYNKGNKSNNLS
jgi:hypothetical protein